MSGTRAELGRMDLDALRCLLADTVERLDPAYRGPYDSQALVQYLEALVLEARARQ